MPGDFCFIVYNIYFSPSFVIFKLYKSFNIFVLFNFAVSLSVIDGNIPAYVHNPLSGTVLTPFDSLF